MKLTIFQFLNLLLFFLKVKKLTVFFFLIINFYKKKLIWFMDLFKIQLIFCKSTYFYFTFFGNLCNFIEFYRRIIIIFFFFRSIINNEPETNYLSEFLDYYRPYREICLNNKTNLWKPNEFFDIGIH